MPVIIGPSPTIATPVTSSDGVLTVTPRADLGAALITVQFGSAAVSARTVTVTRNGLTVRGLDAHAAPSGVTAGIDAEPNLGATLTYRATARAANGTTWTSAAVTVSVPRSPSRAWWTCLSRPELSCLLSMSGGGYPDWPLKGRVGEFAPLSSPYTTTAIGVPSFDRGSAQVFTTTIAEGRAFAALMQIREPLLLQPDALQARARPDDYITVISATPSQPGDVNPEFLIWNVTLSRGQRPPTAGSTVNIPGRSIGALAAQYATIGALPSPPLRWLTG